MKNFIIENWSIIILAIIYLAVFIVAIYKFIKSPRKSQIRVMEEWLKYAVTIAESELGSGTGQLKLRMVYNMFISKFPRIAKLISFEAFGEYVDEALKWLNNQLESNTSVATIVNGNIEEEESENE